MATNIKETKLGRYELVKYLARAGIADLLLARARGMAGFERFVVIKRLREEQASDAKFVEMFVAEARLSAALHHHNIIQVQDIGEADGKPYFAMEYVHGEDLRTLLARLHSRGEQLPLQYIITIGSAVAAALHHAHERRGPDSVPLGIVHRDVTPTNILVAYDGNVKVMDFGLAKAAIARIETQAGVLKGTVPYMAPEQCTGKPAERRSDIFSLGIVLYELATVRRLFKGTTEFHTMSAIVNGSLPRPSLYRKDLPAPLEKIILKALARDPADRFQTAEELCTALEAFAKTNAMSTSVVGLAGYMKTLFGERPEPWLVEGEVPEATASLDFDGAAVGLAKSPKEASDGLAIAPSIAATDTSPLVDAQSRARSRVPATETTKVTAALIKHLRTPPVPGRSARARVEPTVVVAPLPAPAPAPETATATEHDPAPIDTWPVKKLRKRERRALGVIAVAGVFVAIVVVIGFSGGAHQSPAAAATVPKPVPKVEPKAEPAAAPAKPWDQMTERDYQRAQEAVVATPPPMPPTPTPTIADVAAKSEPAPTPTPAPSAEVAAKPEPAAATTTPIATATPELEPAPIDPTPELTQKPLKPHVMVAAKPALKPERPTRTKPTKTPPKWDPDSLLPKK